MKWTLSNQITMGRIGLIPVFIAAFYLLPSPLNHYISGLIFAIAGFTDWLDGYLARTRGEVTAFGRFLDPVADKLLVAVALVLLAEGHYAPGILAAIIIGREITIGALREWLAEKAAVVKVSQMGKWKTVAQMCAIEGLLLHVDIFDFPMHFAGLILLWIAAILTLWSGYEYLRNSWPELTEKIEPNDTDSNNTET
ncbi:MAG: CDP-diacylglycerol--glycerol-3-phosphate 3-phosphatidyltransferase [Mariprofundaceae bacterium]